MMYLRLSSIIGFWMVSAIVYAQSIIPEFYSSKDSCGLYSITLDITSYHFSGLLLLKMTNDSSFRVVMTSEMGPKILDMVLQPSGYKVGYAFNKLNKKRILRTFYEDFATLFCIGIRPGKLISKDNPLSPPLVIDQGKNRKIRYILDPVTKNIISGTVEEGKAVKSAFHFLYEPGASVVNSMKLEHQKFIMIIFLQKIKTEHDN